MLRANAAACREFYAKYFDDRGFLLCVERWGGDDGPDDAIENLTADSTVVSLVNVSQVESRTVVIQAGGYGEHLFTSMSVDNGAVMQLNSTHLTIQLEPGCGARLKLGMKRYANQPTLAMPWNRNVIAP